MKTCGALSADVAISYPVDLKVGRSMDEMRESVKLIEQCLDQMPPGPVAVAMPDIAFPLNKITVKSSMEAMIHHFDVSAYGFPVPKGEAYVSIEAPKGELGFYIISDGSSYPYRMTIRAPSYVNLQSLPLMTEGRMVSDVITCIGTIDIVLGEVDR